MQDSVLVRVLFLGSDWASKNILYILLIKARKTAKSIKRYGVYDRNVKNFIKPACYIPAVLIASSLTSKNDNILHGNKSEIYLVVCRLPNLIA